MAEAELLDIGRITERIRQHLHARMQAPASDKAHPSNGERSRGESDRWDIEVQQLLSRLRGARDEFMLEPVPCAGAYPSSFRAGESNGSDSAAFDENLASLQQVQDLIQADLRSHRRVVGRAVATAKTLLRRLLIPILRRQVTYNAANVHLVTQLRADLARAQTELVRFGVVVQQMEEAVRGDLTILRRAIQQRDNVLKALEQRSNTQVDLQEGVLGVLDRRLAELRAAHACLVESLQDRLHTCEEGAAIQKGALDALNQRVALVLANGLPSMQTEIAVLGEWARRDESALQAIRERVVRAETVLRRISSNLAQDPPADVQTPAAVEQRIVGPTLPDQPFDSLVFAERYRGTEEEITERERRYVAYFHGQERVLDIGCGRGEFLELLRDAGIGGTGIDVDLDMVLVCREKGLNVIREDAFSFLDRQPDGCLGGIFAAQVIEHLEPRSIIQLVRLCHRKLKPAGVLILETVNPACISVFARAFYMDMSHRWPCHPEPMRFLLETSGFTNVSLSFASPIDPELRLPRACDLGLTGEGIGRFDKAIDFLNELVFGYQDYAVIGLRDRCDSSPDA